MICIDQRNGIYVTPKYDHIPVFPIHVLKSTNPPNIDCEIVADLCRLLGLLEILEKCVFTLREPIMPSHM